MWALHFAAIYGFNGIVCARPGWDWTWLGMPASTLGIVASGVLALALVAGFAWKAWCQRAGGASRDFIAWFAVGLAALSAVAIVYETLTVWLVPACG
jgi:hypothetical protein